MNYEEIAAVNGESVISRGLASETKQIGKEFYGYAYFKTVSGTYYLPTNKQDIILRADIWDFINVLPEIKWILRGGIKNEYETNNRYSAKD